MSCALRTILDQRLDSPQSQRLLKDLLLRYQDDPQYFLYFRTSLAISLPQELGFDLQTIRMTCDKCALDPLGECKFVEVLVAALQERSARAKGP